VGSDGAIYAGGGDVKLYSNGIEITGESLHFYYSAAVYAGYIKSTSSALQIWSTSAYDLEVHAGDNLRLVANDVIYLNGDYVSLSNCPFMDLPKKSSNPSAAVEGRLYYDTTRDLICYYRSGVGWRILQDNPY